MRATVQNVHKSEDKKPTVRALSKAQCLSHNLMGLVLLNTP